ncbi:hypothetical protein BGX38DRAFT_1229664 [Terfezia claveryi]|nr:hypothetical protein BGX38DRAFT_1229664 [Terfezia claveryi]
MNTPDKNKDRQMKVAPRKVSVEKALDQGIIPEYKLLERQLAATLGDIESRALTVSVNYEHEYFGPETVITTKKVLKIQRYDGDGNWSLRRNPTKNNSIEVFEGNPDDCKGSICSTDFSIPQEPSDGHCDVDVEYVRTRLAKKIAEMSIGEAEENPRKALRMVEELGIRGKGVYAVASELEWRVKIQEEEEETERTMKGLAEEISRKATRQSLVFGDINNKAFSEENTMNSNFECTASRENKLNLHLSDHYREPGSSDASVTEVNQGVQQKADIAVCRQRDSSIIIHPTTLPDRRASQSGESGASDLDETHNSGLEDMSRMQSSRRQHDHVDEAGRIWRELAETKMGLRRDIRPGRHRTPTLLPPITRHSRHNSIDLLKDRHDKERTADLNWTLLASGRVKGKKKERRRRMKKQAMAKRSITGEGGLRTSYQTSTPIETASLYPECGAAQEVASKTPVGERKRRKDLESINTLLHDQYEEHNVFVTETQDAVRVSVGQAGNHTNDEQSNRDTMKSLITLRDIKETDFSPWAF